jgi:uncharacterized protein YjbI with pentapeptide repeats
MANPKQIDLLRSGVAAWNTWRQDHPGDPVDLTGANLRDLALTRVNLSNADLTEADLSGADLCGASLTRSNLTRANFTRAKLAIADFGGSILHHTNFEETDLSACLNLDLSELVFGCRIDLPTLQTIQHLPPAVLNSFRMAQ